MIFSVHRENPEQVRTTTCTIMEVVALGPSYFLRAGKHYAEKYRNAHSPVVTEFSLL